MIKKEVELWVRQALSDLDAAKYNLAGKKYDVAVFLAHQAAEKVLKALRIQELRELIKTHDLLRLAKDVDAPLLLIQKCSLLNPVYIETRYPDFSEKIPAENYTEEQTENFISIAEEILKWAQEKIK